MELIVSSSIVLFLSLLTAFTARYNLLTIPWIEIVRHPSYFGGVKEIQKFLLYLLLWSTTSVIFSVLITLTIINLEQVSLEIFRSTSYGKNTPGIITIAIINIAVYLYIVNKAKKILAFKRSRIHVGLLSQSISGGTVSKNRSLSNIFRIFIYFFPHMFSHLYSYFFVTADNFIFGAANILRKRYGDEVILSFFKGHVVKSDSKHFQEIYKKLNEAGFDDSDKALALLSHKIEFKGFYVTNRYIVNYLSLINIEKKNDLEYELELSASGEDENSGDSDTKITCDVYKFKLSSNTYMFLKEGDLPNIVLSKRLLRKLGSPIHIHTITISKNYPLIVADPEKVIQSIGKCDYHIEGLRDDGIVPEMSASIGCGILADSVGFDPIWVVVCTVLGFLVATIARVKSNGA